jgi:hypothetical protein
MKLPLASEAEVPEAKIVFYLLNPAYRVGKGKARFFTGCGFDAGEWRTLAGALRKHACANEVAKIETTPLGNRFVVEGGMAMPNGTIAGVRAVWFIETGERVPRFVTAYPLKRKQQP